MGRPVKIEELVAELSPRIAEAFLEAIKNVVDRAQLESIVKMLEDGDVDGAVRAVGLDPLSFRVLENTVASVFETGGIQVVSGIPALETGPGLVLDILFDARNIQAETWLRSHSSKLVKDVVDDQRKMVRQHLTVGLEQGKNPRVVALDLVGRVNSKTGAREGGAIGLTTSQEAWVQAYEAELKSNSARALTRGLRDKRFDILVRKAVEAKEPLPAQVRAKLVQAYRNKVLRYRAESIARTEAMTALHKAQDEGYRQAVGAGQVRSQDVRKTWRDSGDLRVRHSHAELDGQTVGFDEQFVTTSGARLLFPGDPNAPAEERIGCRCWCDYRVDFLANVS